MTAPSTAPDPSGPDVVETPPRRRRRWPRVLLVVGLVVVLLASAVGFYAYTIDRSVTGNITRGIDLRSSDPSTGTSERPSEEDRATGTLNYVLLGSDSRDPDNAGKGRSDAIMVVHLNAARTRAWIISFPRDMYVDVPGYGKNKINTAYAFGGAPLMVATLEKLTDVRMDHVVLVDFEGFIKLTDDLDGVTVKNKNAFSSHGYDYPKGKVTISGAKALWFVRERHSLPRGDLDRARNQRAVIKAIVAKGLSAGVVADPVKFTSFLSNVAKHVTVDNSLSDDDIRKTALSLRLEVKDIALMQAPLAGFGTVGDESVDLVDTAKMAELSTALKKDKLRAYLKKYPEG